ncbi:hypothetical protein SCHPADRAFT_908556 [Schizopora paradoxa]|uniref:DUF6533 domain-containing protein n=1 Tax=Schizopora paradoxa TaxID=27342 RepID=A0A0H2RG72_9AGAM|nr:hypothetical protein SCHPADRAFT_908556 [Schizopora paradoxa]
MATLSLSDLSRLLAQTVDVKYFYLSNAVMLYYDTLVYFGDEVEYIWKARWSVGKILYIATRYMAFVDLTVLIVYATYSKLTPADCMHVFRISSWFMVVGVLIAEALLIIRTYALYERSKIILAYLVCLKIALTIPAIKVINETFDSFNYVSSPAPSVLPCMAILTDGHAKMWFAFLCIALFDLNIVSLTLWRAILSWRSVRTNFGPLLATLYRDGIVYFLCLFATSVSNVFVMKTMADTSFFLVLIGFQRALHALLSSKLIINVRKATATSWTLPSALADPLDDRNLRGTRRGELPIDFARSVEMQSRYTLSSSYTGMTSKDLKDEDSRS